MSQLALDFIAPRARTDDPKPAHDAAKATAQANAKIIRAIREHVRVYGPLTRFEIADALCDLLEVQHDTIRSACSRAGMTEIDGGRSPGGRPCARYVIRSEALPNL